jgi:photosystem II stability/assembly factor-like uncharacterized protein
MNLAFPFRTASVGTALAALAAFAALATVTVLRTAPLLAQAPTSTQAPAAPAVKLTSAMFGAIEARHIGPATMSGRISAIDVVNKRLEASAQATLTPEQRIIYVGAAGGGVWKSLDNGTTFKPVFDKVEKASQSIGALAIEKSTSKTDQSKAGSVVWVGTGESNVRNSVSYGTGIYKTTDGGENWKCMGLERSERIARIVIHPKNPDVVYVAVPGALWSDSEDRGVYRTSDGGKSWEKILYVDKETGCADVVMDPADPNTLYASMWTFRRKAWQFWSGGKGSGLFKSTDGGKTWNSLTNTSPAGSTAGSSNGLPSGELGRIVVAVAPSTSATVYALIEAKKTALYRSDDKGATWRMATDNYSIAFRPFYFAEMHVDPTDPNRIYRLNASTSVSEDGGKTFTAFSYGGAAHPDHHAFWIDPQNPMEMLLGTDGGVYRSLDRGKSWSHFRNLPVSQFYHVSTDADTPYNVYGGLQDNGVWGAPARLDGGISNASWKSLGFGDGFYAERDRIDNNIFYFNIYEGNLYRMFLSTGELKKMQPEEKDGEAKYRYHWNTPFVFGKKSPKAPASAPLPMYTASQFLFRSFDRGESWEKISPDLTTNDSAKLAQQRVSGGLSMDVTSAENHCTIYAVAESPFDNQTIWAGTDDGNLQLTTNGGKSWTNLAQNLPSELPRGSWISMIEPSRFDKNTAYVAVHNYMRGDFAPYFFKTTDLGKTWTRLNSPEIRGHAHVIREDVVNKKLLFAGTEMGLYVSLDAGASWVQFTGNVPNVPIRDIAIQQREHDLVLATHGRGIVIIDDLTPLRSLTPESLGAELVVLPSRPAPINWGRSFQDFNGSNEFRGETVGDDPVITYYLRDRMMSGSVLVEVLNAKGEVVASTPGTKRKGINRVDFALRMKAPKVAVSENIAGGAFVGPLLPEGKYGVRITKGERQYTGSITLAPDPRSPFSDKDRTARFQAVMSLYEMQTKLAYIAAASTAARDELTERSAALGAAPVAGLNSLNSTPGTTSAASNKSGATTNDASAASAASAANSPVKAKVLQAASALDSLYKSFVKEREEIFADKEDKLREHLAELYGTLNNYSGPPSKAQLERLAYLQRELAKVETQFDTIVKTHLASANAALKGSNAQEVPVLQREAFAKQGD